MSADPQIWVLTEAEQSGRLSRASEAVLKATAAVTAAARSEAAAIVAGQLTERITESVAACGIGHVCSVPDIVADAQVEEITVHLAAAATELRPRVFLFPDTLLTRDLAPRLAARLAVGLVTHCVEVEVDHQLILRAYKRVAAGLCETSSICQDSFVQMATVVPPREAGTNACAVGAVKVSTWHARPPIRNEVLRRKRVSGVVSEAPGAADLPDAEVIVGVGHGIGSPRFLPAVETLAELLGAPVGCTRKVAEQGWLSRAHQIGTSGATVSPRVYVAIGISGAMQHMLGVGHPETIIAINTDPHAPIFRVAQLGVVGDALEVIPALTDVLRKRADTGSGVSAEALYGAM